eukprot:5187357-Prymnesium_polylepis.2
MRSTWYSDVGVNEADVAPHDSHASRNLAPVAAQAASSAGIISAWSWAASAQVPMLRLGAQ